MKIWVWKVTGYGPLIPKNKYGRREGFKIVDVEAETEAEAIEKALKVLPANRKEAIKAVKFVRKSLD